ncbi:uncharacterized protein [Chelonus insularis]|uniref:uncharacterized protein n=1 Tax=Chelonus insularis TaxID=460826 RepID=UPI001589D7A3|nr:uncharacterized protein LOC118072481 [Chelonus insularis]
MGQVLSNLIDETDYLPQKTLSYPIQNHSRHSTGKKNVENLQPCYKSNSQSSLTNIAKEFESLQKKALKFGLDTLVEPIKDTVDSLKDLKFPCNSSSTHKAIPSHLRCNCQVWGPDSITSEGEWVCSCRNQCQCDKLDWATIPNIPKDPSIRSVDNCWNCNLNEVEVNSLGEEVKGNGSFIATDIETSSKDDPATESRGEIANVTKSHSQTFTSSLDDAKMEHSDNDERGINEDEVKEVKKNDERKIINSKTGSTCPCGCKYITRGELRKCICGCGQMFEIIDDVDQNSNETLPIGRCCNSVNYIPGDCLKVIPELSLDKYNDSGLMTTIELLQMKCQVKDELIAVLAQRLINLNDVDVVAENLTTDLPKTDIDFDRSLLYKFLKQQKPPSEEKLSQHDSVPAPRNFRVVKLILQSLHIAWDLPKELSNIRGYEVLVNGVVTTRVRSATRSQAILSSLDLTKPTELTLYSVATNGYISEPLKITFPAYKFV